MITDPIHDTAELVHETTDSVKSLGPVTVAFFLLLAFVFFLGWSYVQKNAEATENVLLNLQVTEKKVDDLSKTLNSAIINIGKLAEENSYIGKQTCRNTAKTEMQKAACDPPPGARSPLTSTNQ